MELLHRLKLAWGLEKAEGVHSDGCAYDPVFGSSMHAEHTFFTWICVIWPVVLLGTLAGTPPQPLPMFTSCCSAWVETEYPNLIPYLTTWPCCCVAWWTLYRTCATTN
jgi:iron only hydrogenase large subunit-like protein